VRFAVTVPNCSQSCALSVFCTGTVCQPTNPSHLTAAHVDKVQFISICLSHSLKTSLDVTMRYDTVDLYALKSRWNGQLNLLSSARHRNEKNKE